MAISTMTMVTLLLCRVYGVRAEGNVDPAMDMHGELKSQNVLFKAETVKAAAQALGVSRWACRQRCVVPQLDGGCTLISIASFCSSLNLDRGTAKLSTLTQTDAVWLSSDFVGQSRLYRS